MIRLVASTAVLGLTFLGSAAQAPPGEAAAALTTGGATASASRVEPGAVPPPVRAEAAAAHGPNRYEYRVVLACQAKRLSDTTDGEATNCSYAQTACVFRYPASDPRAGENLYRLEYRPTDNGSAPWALVREMCGLGDAPPGVAAPRIPSLGQLQTAFRHLPFSRPTVSVQPVGNVTLVNLPTFYQAVWPGGEGLQPGEVSRPVQLLSWSVEFRIAAQSYDFQFGDGSTSGAVTDPGGVYPDGSIRHTYRRPQHAAQVKVDARLTAQYRANGGAWTTLDAVADLQDEPVTVLQVTEAHARLVTR